MREVLVTGGNGQLGTELQRFAWPDGWRAVTIDLAELDLTDVAGIAAIVASRRWTAVINGAAYTAVDKAESDVVTAWKINALAPVAFAAACETAGIPLVQVSTDYVFDGSNADGWQPDDATGPLNVYGASKLGGELAVRTACQRHAIVRTSWVVSAHGTNFIKTMLRLGKEREMLSVVADQHGAPTSAADLAAALATIVMRMTDDSTIAGTWHFSNAGTTTWAGFADAIFDGARLRGAAGAQVLPIATAAYPTPARRPAHSRLSHAAIERDFAIIPRDWHAALDDILDELIGPK